MRIRANVLNLFLIDRGEYSCVFERDVDVVLESAKWDLSITFVIPLHLILESANTGICRMEFVGIETM